MWTCFTPYYLSCAWDLCFIENDIQWSLLYFQQIVSNRLRHFVNAQNVVSIRSENVYIILLCLLFSLLYLQILFRALFALFLLVAIDVVYINSVRLKNIDFSCQFIELHYRWYNLNFLKLRQLDLDGDLFRIENNGIAPLVLKIISQTVLTIYILKMFLLQYVSHNLYPKVVKDCSILIANIYLIVTIIMIKISSWRTMSLLLFLITLRESRRHKRGWHLNI